jgi:hypothetical protein
MVTGDERAMFSGAVVREGSAEPDAMLRGHWHGREGLWRMRHGKLSCGTIPGRGCADVGRVLSGNGSREGIGVEDRPAMMRRWQNRATGVPDRVVDEMGGRVFAARRAVVLRGVVVVQSPIRCRAESFVP